MALLQMPGPRITRALGVPLAVLLFLVLLLTVTPPGSLPDIPIINQLDPSSQRGPAQRPNHAGGAPAPAPPPPLKYRPTPTWTPPKATEPFPLLARSSGTPPPVPAYNVPRPNLHREYGLNHMPPLFIGFTRNWPMLLQCVVSYVTAGWPAEGIYVVENTGVHGANQEGKLSLQNPFYLNHTTLRRLGVNVVRTPVLLSFAQMQNFFLEQAHERAWPYYFYSHQDVLVFSFEDGVDKSGRPGDREWEFYDEEDEAEIMHPAAAGQPGYKTIYENSLRELNKTIEREKRWAWRWFQYDHLTLVNRAALDAVGGWDTWIPYYATDCDMNGRLAMDGWTMKYRRVGIINDVSTTLEDLGALYRVPGVAPKWVDPNPEYERKKEEERKKKEEEEKKKQEEEENKKKEEGTATHTKRDLEARIPNGEQAVDASLAHALETFRELVKQGDAMGSYKYRDSDHARNSWQKSQRGGAGEPFYYDPDGFARAFDILTEAGREIYRQKWGHRDCDIFESTALRLGDQWKVEKDWE